MISTAAKVADKAIKQAAKEREKQAKAADSLRIKTEKERVKALTKVSTKKPNPYPAASLAAYGQIPKPKTKQDADALNRSFRTSDHEKCSSLTLW